MDPAGGGASERRGGKRRARTLSGGDDEGVAAVEQDPETTTGNPRAAMSQTSSSESTSRRRAPKPNRQRCKEFRERRKNYTSDLDSRVVALREEVSELLVKKSLYASRVMHRRHHSLGSLEKLIREYYQIFRYGVAVDRPLPQPSDSPPGDERRLISKAQRQINFIERYVDDDAIYAGRKGPEGCIMQWTYYTAAYASFIGYVKYVELSGSEEDPILYAHTVYQVVLQRDTFSYLFPHVLSNEPLVQRFIGLSVPCSVVGIYRFNEDGKIISEHANIELTEAFLNAGCHVDDVAEIMSGFVAVDEGAVPDNLRTEAHKPIEDIVHQTLVRSHKVEVMEDDEPEEERPVQATSPGAKLSISYLLAEENEEEKENVMSQASLRHS
ncbi:hypothetical protein Poli38472_011272 [Pythium oligandrum]|uniref:BZIP domain-containing protein n=1 Tax=Pythium oligandrum TaxID=41045 RepID=A0A8K1FQ75_PYTOL|nr:hypothetical protein Poli38472_011272 [Pythium oligandrum]|eukprot:TMW67652.1 hypothetical protein Poli38472_011272 [Pythium oligandrum]